VTTIDELIRDLIVAAPELEAVRRAHLADNDELLPHVLFGDVTRWVVERGPVPKVLAVLEHHMEAGDADGQNLIAVSFLENLFGDDPGERAVQNALGPRLKAEFDAMWNWAPDDPEAAT
jgi:hypothetical protein